MGSCRAIARQLQSPVASRQKSSGRSREDWRKNNSFRRLFGERQSDKSANRSVLQKMIPLRGNPRGDVLFYHGVNARGGAAG